jgi:hypothetical protein
MEKPPSIVYGGGQKRCGKTRTKTGAAAYTVYPFRGGLREEGPKGGDFDGNFSGGRKIFRRKDLSARAARWQSFQQQADKAGRVKEIAAAKIRNLTN